MLTKSKNNLVVYKSTKHDADGVLLCQRDHGHKPRFRGTVPTAVNNMQSYLHASLPMLTLPVPEAVWSLPQVEADMLPQLFKSPPPKNGSCEH